MPEMKKADTAAITVPMSASDTMVSTRVKPSSGLAEREESTRAPPTVARPLWSASYATYRRDAPASEGTN
ncbi:hypothetical protein GCM10010201_20230 [Pilimelia columellifera subsp. columellifera]|uniref:Uncharacterized protein n=1 Tax=Pilimelia columellifera subsp. columellifera TaxID=706583 RepID=A0ABP6ASH0_9ACTN